jgi:hypothetical protein
MTMNNVPKYDPALRAKTPDQLRAEQLAQIQRAKELQPLAQCNADFGWAHATEQFAELCKDAQTILRAGAFIGLLWAATRTVCWIVALCR